MTEKRFTKQEVNDGSDKYKINVSNFIVEILDDDIPMHYSTIVNRLNEQHKTITRLEKENEQLKNENNKWIVDYNGLNAEYQWLKEENNKLKSILEEMKNRNDEIWLLDGRIIKLKKGLKE